MAVIDEILQLVARRQPLSLLQQDIYLDWLKSTDAAAAKVNELEQKYLEQSGVIGSIFPRGATSITKVSQISRDFGDMVAGRFLAPAPTATSTEPTNTGFTGSFMSGAGESFLSALWNIGGVNAGVLQFGLSQTDGKAYFGAGKAYLDTTGLVLKYSTGGEGIHFLSTNNSDTLARFYVNTDNFLVMDNLVQDSGFRLYVITTDAGTPSLEWKEDPANNNVTQLNVAKGSDGGKINIGGDVVIWAGKDGVETVFNDTSFDTDFRIEGATNPNVLRIDAGLDKATSLAWDGWASVPHTWTRTGDHTFTVATDVTATYRKGTKVRYGDGGTDYGVIASSSHAAGTTTINLIPNTDYAMAATTITDTYLSYIENPEGFPNLFNWTPTHTRSDGNYTNAPTSVYAVFRVVGNRVFFKTEYTMHATPGSSGYQKFTLPIVPNATQSIGRNVGAGQNMNTNNNMTPLIIEGEGVRVIKYDGTVEVAASTPYLMNGWYDF